MKNYILILVIVMFLGVGYFAYTQKEQLGNIAQPQGDLTINPNGEPSITTDNSKYVEHSATTLDENKDKRRVLFFYASWCPTCRPADANFKENAKGFPDDLIVIRVNYNDPATDNAEKDLAKKYGITYQHTFVQIDSEGKAIAKWNGGQTKELLDNIK